jgi:quinol monooxygenase YgiN
MSSLTPYCLNVRVVIKPERKDEFLTVIKADQVGTLTDEAGALQFLIMQDNTNPNQ